MSPIIQTTALGPPPWPTIDPFLFCVHHNDQYPKGNAQLGPQDSLSHRNIGSDFSNKDGWSMYHGTIVPGFPRHPHRGFETITIARKGYIDHSDSLGATARLGPGDVQWMTAGRGIVHSEMFPLLQQERNNPAELFQIWINLPRSSKLVDPYFTMIWRENVPTVSVGDARITLYAGELENQAPPSPPPDSWASREDTGVGVWSIQIPKNGSLTLPKSEHPVRRSLYFFSGARLHIAGVALRAGTRIEVDPAQALPIQNGSESAELLLLQGKPIGEPVAQYGPFVMNTQQEIRTAIYDYQRTGFGGWPWKRNDPVHVKAAGRFAIHADGSREERSAE